MSEMDEPTSGGDLTQDDRRDSRLVRLPGSHEALVVDRQFPEGMAIGHVTSVAKNLRF